MKHVSMSSSTGPEDFELQTISLTAHNQSATNAKTDVVVQLAVREDLT